MKKIELTLYPILCQNITLLLPETLPFSSQIQEKHCKRARILEDHLLEMIEMYSPYKAKWRIPKLILKACTISLNTLNYIYIF